MKQLLLLAALILCGCTTPEKISDAQPNPMLPKSALTATEGIGRLFFPATEPGVIYVYDCDTTDVVLNAPILKNQRFVLDPQNSVATIEGKKVFEGAISKKHTHRIYLDPHGVPPKPEKKS